MINDIPAWTKLQLDRMRDAELELRALHSVLDEVAPSLNKSDANLAKALLADLRQSLFEFRLDVEELVSPDDE